MSEHPSHGAEPNRRAGWSRPGDGTGGRDASDDARWREVFDDALWRGMFDDALWPGMFDDVHRAERAGRAVARPSCRPDPRAPLRRVAGPPRGIGRFGRRR